MASVLKKAVAKSIPKKEVKVMEDQTPTTEVVVLSEVVENPDAPVQADETVEAPITAPVQEPVLQQGLQMPAPDSVVLLSDMFAEIRSIETMIEQLKLKNEASIANYLTLKYPENAIVQLRDKNGKGTIRGVSYSKTHDANVLCIAVHGAKGKPIQYSFDEAVRFVRVVGV